MTNEKKVLATAAEFGTTDESVRLRLEDSRRARTRRPVRTGSYAEMPEQDMVDAVLGFSSQTTAPIRANAWEEGVHASLHRSVMSFLLDSATPTALSDVAGASLAVEAQAVLRSVGGTEVSDRSVAVFAETLAQMVQGKWHVDEHAYAVRVSRLLTATWTDLVLRALGGLPRVRLNEDLLPAADCDGTVADSLRVLSSTLGISVESICAILQDFAAHALPTSSDIVQIGHEVVVSRDHIGNVAIRTTP